MSDISLTQTVQKGGCAAKLPAGELSRILQGLTLPRHPQLVVGVERLDDASLFDLGDGRYLISTLDFFTPIVDNPRDFGAIAAANALSDVYAMGGEPTLALTILAFPMKVLPLSILEDCMKGACEKISEAGAALGGGHSIDDDTLKLGFSVNGFVSKERAWTNAGAKPGDILILTKGLGTGTIATGIKNKKAKDFWIDAALESMKRLNSVPKSLIGETIHAATDITGFGLAGHALQMARASNVSFEFDIENLPIIPGALEALKMGLTNRAHQTNRAYTLDFIQFHVGISPLHSLLVWDAQTSGGLLLSVPSESSDTILNKLSSQFPESKKIGRVLPRIEGPILNFS